VQATVETPDGTVEGAFPDLISPHQPFIDMQSIAHATGDGEIVIRFEGDLWEMEDQRNWTDASYKTYSTPLRLPYPVEIHEGDRVWQRVTIEARGGDAAVPVTGEAKVQVTVDPSRGRTIPPIGLGVASHGGPLSDEDVALLQVLGPAHLHVALDLTESDWQESLARAKQEAGALGAAVAVEVIAGADGAGLKDLANALSASEVDVARVLVFADGEMVTRATVLAAAREAFGQAGVETLVGGGTRAYFTELNRATLPLEAMDVVSYTLNPQVHAFDNASMTETLAAQPETVRSARAIVGDRPLVVGPITLRPPFNPNATGPDPEPAPGELPSSVDYRQPSLFAAGWLAGSVNALGNAGVDALTYFETTGWRGLIERRDHPLRVGKFHSWPGMVFPVYHVLADVADFQGGQILPITLSDGLRVQGLALRDGGRVRVVLANMTDEPLSMSLEIPGAGGAMVRRLDDRTVSLAATDPGAFRGLAEPIDMIDGLVNIDLPPFGLATVDTESGEA
jgi:D-apionolactonase